MDNNESPSPDIREKTFLIHLFDVTPPELVRCTFTTYMHNGTLAMRLMSRPDDPFDRNPSTGPLDFYVPYADVTVNLEGSALLPPDTQFVDENNLPGIGDWLEMNDIAERVPLGMQSGYVMYQAFRFNIPEEVRNEVEERRIECHNRDFKERQHSNQPKR